VFRWHPVRLIGRLAEAMEKHSRRWFGIPIPADSSGKPDCSMPETATEPALGSAAPPPGTRLDPAAVAAGSIAWFLTIGVSATLALIVSWLTWTIHPAFGLISDTVLIWASIAPGDLAAHALRVKRALERDQRELAESKGKAGTTPIASSHDSPGRNPVHGRAAVAMIVGRDVSMLDETGVARACIESVAESSIDGAAAPIFWAALLGPWAALAYRCVNTLDSMFGHRNTRYFSFGLVAARADDLANWLPARFSSIIACLAAPAAQGSIRGAFASFLKYRRSHASPNAGHPEAAYAGAFGLRLGGPVFYPEGLTEKPWINPGGRNAGLLDIPSSVALMYVQTLASAIAFLACRFSLVYLLKSIQAGI
jgi:adenosylcobinamide-phosphate synthase